MNQRVSKVIGSSILHGNHHSHVMGYFGLQEMTSSGELSREPSSANLFLRNLLWWTIEPRNKHFPVIKAMARCFCVVVLIFFISLFVSCLIFYLFASLTLLVVFIIRSGFLPLLFSQKTKMVYLDLPEVFCWEAILSVQCRTFMILFAIMIFSPTSGIHSWLPRFL